LSIGSYGQETFSRELVETLRTARTDDVVSYTEFCKCQRPSMYAKEIQKQLIENQVVLPVNVPFPASISHVLTRDLG